MNKLEVMETFAYNLERLRNELGYSQDKMANLLEISSSTYRRIINCEISKVDIYTYIKLFELSKKFAFQFCFPEYTNNRLFRIVESCTEMNELALKDVEKYISFRKAISFNEKDKERIIPIYHPMGDLADTMLFNSFSYSPLDISICPDSIKQQVDCALEITTNHFHPTYHKGDILLISQRPPKDGEIGLFIHKKTLQMYIRLFRMESPRKLIPISDTGRIITVDENNVEAMNEWIKFGVVVTKMY